PTSSEERIGAESAAPPAVECLASLAAPCDHQRHKACNRWGRRSTPINASSRQPAGQANRDHREPNATTYIRPAISRYKKVPKPSPVRLLLELTCWAKLSLEAALEISVLSHP